LGASDFLIFGGSADLHRPGAGPPLAVLRRGDGIGIEALGVRYGFPFGRYEYSSVLQPQVARVPLVLVCAWVVVTAYAWQAVSRRFASAGVRAAVGGAWMMALDLLIDPVATPTTAFRYRILQVGSWRARSYWQRQGAGAAHGARRRECSA
jgi:uncharacterized membrane protein